MQFYFFTRYGKKPHTAVEYPKDKKIYLVFGKESTGIPLNILQGNLNNCLRIPMNEKVRALNVSNSVAVGIYEVLRQNNFEGLLFTEPFKGEDYLEGGIE